MRVDVALPVHNGGLHLAATLQGLLAQTHGDLRVLVVDNASTDDTQEVVRAVQRQDDRVGYRRNPHNLGSVANFNLALQQTEAPLVMWASDHDAVEPTYVARCVEQFARDEVVLAYSAADWIDGHGEHVEDVRSVVDTRGLGRLARLNVSLWGTGPYGYAVYGVLRRTALARLRRWPAPYPDLVAPDVVLLSELAMLGEFAYVDEPLFHLRRMGDYDDFDAYTDKLGKRAGGELEAVRLYAAFLLELGRAGGSHADGRAQAWAGRLSALTCGAVSYRWIAGSLRAQARR